MSHWEIPSKRFYKVGELLDGKERLWEHHKNSQSLCYYVQISNMLDNYELKNTNHLINNACLINSNFSADGELENLHENCHLLRTIEESLLVERLKEHCCFRETTFHNIMNIDSLVWLALPSMFESWQCSHWEIWWNKQTVQYKNGFLTNSYFSAAGELDFSLESHWGIPWRFEEQCYIRENWFHNIMTVKLNLPAVFESHPFPCQGTLWIKDKMFSHPNNNGFPIN